MPAPKGKRLRSSSTSKIHPSPYTLIASTCTPATWTTRNSSGASNASSMPACTTTLSRCSSARPRTAPSASGKACEPSPENRGGNTPPWPHSLLPLHGNLPLRCRVGLLRGARGAVRQSGRLLHLQRCPCRLRPPAGAAIPGDVAGAGFAAIARGGGARPRTWPVRPGRAGLVGEEVSRILPRFAIPAVQGSARAAQGLAGTLARRVESGKAEIYSSIEQLPQQFAVPAIVFANEFFDALPVEVVSHRGELRLGCEQGRFVESFAPPSAAALEYLDRYSVHHEAGERVEAALSAQRFMGNIAQRLGRGFAIIIDYGYTRDEQLAGRHRGTVTAFRRHTISASPYEAPGEQDITAHVNFTALQGAAAEAGMESLALLTQAQFLMGIGEANQFADAFEDTRLPQEQAKVALQLKHLVTPAGMGESFHVLVMGRGVDVASARGLSGLKFAR